MIKDILNHLCTYHEYEVRWCDDCEEKNREGREGGEENR